MAKLGRRRVAPCLADRGLLNSNNLNKQGKTSKRMGEGQSVIPFISKWVPKAREAGAHQWYTYRGRAMTFDLGDLSDLEKRKP